MIVPNQWVPSGPSGRCDRRLGPPGAGTAARARSRIRDLRHDHGRRPARRRAGVDRSGREARRPHHFPLRHGLADDGGVRPAAARPRAAVPQHHAGALLRALRRQPLPPVRAQPRRPARRWSGTPTPRWATRSTTGRNSRTWASPTPASSRSRSTSSKITSGAAGADPRGRCITDGPLLNFLFVGRIVPNKKIEDHIRLAEHYKRYVDSRLSLHLRRQDRRHAALLQHDPAADPRVRDAAGSLHLYPVAVPDEDLATYYRTADVYISLSEHEGFCVPLLEAMSADVPVLAYASTAVPDTLGGAGVQFFAERPRIRRRAPGGARLQRHAQGPGDSRTARPPQRFGDARIRRELERLTS